MILSPGGTDTNPDGTDDNFGPHCRNCHTGANSCNQCHAGGAYTATIDAAVAGKTNYTPQSNVRTSAVADTNGQCLDGGFSFPHRTLGANMLKDELYGVDFDGSPIDAGDVRSAGGAAGVATAGYNWVETINAGSISEAVQTDSGVIAGAAAENLDSVCIDCHGDATYYQPNLANELLLKGLP